MRKQLFYWSLYDFGSSAFSAIVQTFLFAPYFVQAIAPNPAVGSALWGYTNGISALFVALSAPLFGAIADKGGSELRWLMLMTAFCVAATALMGVLPVASPLIFWLALIFLATFAAEISFVFYNALLPRLALEEEIGRWSGWGWALGYLGGLLSLFAAWGLDSIRHTPLLAALWFLLFAAPLFLFGPKTAGKVPFGTAIASGMGEFFKSFGLLKEHKSFLWFLLAHLLFIDALTTLFIFGGIFATVEMGIGEGGLIVFAVLLHITSALGAFFFSFFDDLWGAKRVVVIALIGLIVLTSGLLTSTSIVLFWGFAGSLGIFVGPLQASSRSFVAKLAPKELCGEFFGLLAFSGKATAFIGPLVVGVLSDVTGSLRVAMWPIAALFLGALLLLRRVPRE